MVDKIQNPPQEHKNGIATAPGDIPLPMIEQRIALKAEQFRHDNTIRPFAPTSQQPVIISATHGTAIEVERAEVWYTIDGSFPDQQAYKLPMTAVSVDWQPRAGYLTHWQAELPSQMGGTAVRYRIAGWLTNTPKDAPPDLFAKDGQGFWSYLQDNSPVTTFAYYVEPDNPIGPNWMNEAIIYHIFLDRYHPANEDGRFANNLDANERHGGTLRGVTQTLPYLADLGINCIWLSPINISDTYHRYDATDLFLIDPELGTNEDLHELVEQAHAQNIRVILDFVPSHISWQHPAFKAAQADPHAETASWFVFTEWPNKYRCFLGIIPFLASINTNDPGARDHLIQSALYWIHEFGLDGFRLDHAIGHGMDFWLAFRQAIQAAKPDVVTIGEVTDSADALRRYKGRLSHILDFPLATALRNTFATNQWHVAALDNFLNMYERFMDDGPNRASFLDNHDMNRFLFIAGGHVSRLKMAALCQFTLTPTPIIYYGTEVGLSQTKDKDDETFGGDHHVRATMPWDEAAWDQDLLTFYKRLIQLRREETGMHRGNRQRLHVDTTTQTYAYYRDYLIVAFNLSDSEQKIPLPSTIQAKNLLITTGADPIIKSESIMLPGNTAVILR